MKRKWWVISSISVIFVALLAVTSYAITKKITSDSFVTTESFNTNDSKSDSSSLTDTDDSITNSSDDDSYNTDTYGIGDKVGYTDGTSFTVDSVNYYNGNDIDTPDSGNRYVIIKVTLKNESDDKWDYNRFDFNLNADGDSSNTSELISDGPYSELNTLSSGSLDPGASKTAYLIGQAPADTDNLQLRYQLNSRSDELSVDLN